MAGTHIHYYLQGIIAELRRLICAGMNYLQNNHHRKCPIFIFAVSHQGCINNWSELYPNGVNITVTMARIITSGGIICFFL